jgi:hypothetical protein
MEQGELSMRRKLILSGTAAALLASVSFAAAQGPAREPAGPTAPNAQSQERLKAGPAHHPEGQSTPQNRGQVQRDGNESHSTTGQATPEPQRGSPQPKGAESTPKAGDQPAAPRQRNGNKRDDNKDRQNQQTQKSEPNKAQPSQSQSQRGQPGAHEPDQTQGQAGARANISTEQRTRIRESIHKMGNAPRVNNVNFAISVGTVVPRTVHVVALPETVIEIYPAWRGYVFFLVGDEIIVVEPNSHRIVAVLPA